jgi:hypothetical protein
VVKALKEAVNALERGDKKAEKVRSYVGVWLQDKYVPYTEA